MTGSLVQQFHKLSMLILGLALLTSTAFGQALNSSTASVTLNATLAESLTVVAAPSNVNFTLVSGATANGSAPVAITTTWVLAPSRTNVTLVGYFSSAAAALTNGTTNIPSAEVLGQVLTGVPTTYTAFTQNAVLGPAGAGLALMSQAINSANVASSRTDNLDLQIDLTAQPQLPAGTYTGTLILQAQAL